MRKVIGLLLAAAVGWPSAVLAQATTRPCGPIEAAGPACLLARSELPTLPSGKIYWHLDRFPSRAAAERAAAPASVVAEAFGSIWLFTIAQQGWHARGGKHVSTVGPLPTGPASAYNAEYIRSVFNPGTTAPLHVHSGPEAFFAVEGDTCLETPAGVRTGRGAGNNMMIEAGPPMLLMAIGKVPRKGFALILHDASQPPTTLTQAWKPQGLCSRQLAADQAH